jgi:chaperone modulatory protein CbpM
MWSEKIFRIDEVAHRCGLDTQIITEWVARQWITPPVPEKFEFDREDIARINLIRNLQETIGVNDESIPIILHLLDQLHCAKSQSRQAMAEGKP